MGNFKFKKHANLVICLLLIISVFSGCSNNYTKKQAISGNPVNDFLEKNHANVDISNGNYNNGFSIMDSDIKKNNVILTGEDHAVAKNFEVKLALLKHLNQKEKIRYLLVEMGYSNSCYINEYLESGDESKLKPVYNGLPGTFEWSKESYNFWVGLRKYNSTIPENQRIKVVGIDIEHQVKTACEYINSILPSNAVPKEIQPAIEQYTDIFKLNNSKNNEASIKAIENLQSDIKAKPSIYNSYLGIKYFDFTMVVDNMVNSINAYASNERNFSTIREPAIYSNFIRIYSHFPSGKYFGEFGMEHVYQRSYDSYPNNNMKNFAMYLNSSESPVKGKVLSIAYGYENCEYMNPQNNYAECKADDSQIKDLNTLNGYSKSDITVFKLDGDSSPFNSKTNIVSGSNGGFTTDYFKYIILIKNSKGATPLGKL